MDRLLAHGYTDIRCNVRRKADIPKLERLSNRYANASLEYCIGNLKHREDAARAVRGAHLIFHLAAGKSGAPADLFLDSVVASRNLLDAIDEYKRVRIVLVSSFGVYGIAGLGRGARVNEETPLEPHPEWRDPYSHAKLRQERMFWDYRARRGFELVVLRPGVIYGPGGGHFSSRVGLKIGGWLLHLGGTNVLPLTYVDNCAEAIVLAGTHEGSAGQVYNVNDDDLPTCREYLRAYKKHVAKVRSIWVPFVCLRLFSRLLAKYDRYSKGQLPAIFTPYKVETEWGGNRFDNTKIRSIGWHQSVTTSEGLRRSFAAFKRELDPTGATRAHITRESNPPLEEPPVKYSAGRETAPTARER